MGARVFLYSLRLQSEALGVAPMLSLLTGECLSIKRRNLDLYSTLRDVLQHKYVRTRMALNQTESFTRAYKNAGPHDVVF